MRGKGHKPYFVVKHDSDPLSLRDLVFFFTLIDYEPSQQHLFVIFIKPFVLSWEVWYENKSKYAEKHGNQALNNENPEIVSNYLSNSVWDILPSPAF